jgi:pimeloyl-ACP methyl ester carboxylesterase
MPICGDATWKGGSEYRKCGFEVLVVGCRRDGGKSEETKLQHYVAALVQRKLDCRGWRLVLTGHSLGAGAAALLALYLRSRFHSAHPRTAL